MLPRALLPENHFYGPCRDPLEIVTYNCPCREAWKEETEAWLKNWGMEWQDTVMGLSILKFNDKDTFLMFKLAFAGTLSQKCRH